MAIDVEADVRYPTRADDWERTLVIGTVLTLLSAFVLPILPLGGYLLRVARAGMAGADPPPFDDWVELTVEGLVALVVLFVYQLPAILVSLVALGGLLGLAVGTDRSMAVGLVVFLVGVLVASVLSLVLGYLGVVGVLVYAETRRVGAAFDPGRLRRALFDTGFLGGWLYGLLLFVAASVVLGVAGFVLNLFALVPLVGILFLLVGLVLLAPLSAAVSFYVELVAFRVWGRAYAAAVGLDRDDLAAGHGDAGDENSQLGSGQGPGGAGRNAPPAGADGRDETGDSAGAVDSGADTGGR